jgi:glutaryl-CoA dehydrogenase
VLDGEKRWIGNGTVADVLVVWARETDDGQVKGFLVEKGAPGLDARRIEGKVSVRAVWQADLTLQGVRVSAADRLPGANTFKDAASVLASTRNSVAWSALGHATAAYEVALAYSQQREQFGQQLAGFQLVQDKLVRMLSEVTGMQLYCLRLAQLLAEGKLTDTIASLAKLNNTRKAREVILEARELLGGNGILLEYHVVRHMADIEAIYTYEGTADIQELIVGKKITGASAFV